jgi:hypothetical protein
MMRILSFKRKELNPLLSKAEQEQPRKRVRSLVSTSHSIDHRRPGERNDNKPDDKTAENESRRVGSSLAYQALVLVLQYLSVPARAWWENIAYLGDKTRQDHMLLNVRESYVQLKLERDGDEETTADEDKELQIRDKILSEMETQAEDFYDEQELSPLKTDLIDYLDFGTVVQDFQLEAIPVS